MLPTCFIQYSYSIVSWREENIAKNITGERSYICSALWYLLKNKTKQNTCNLCVSPPGWSKPTWFKGQLDSVYKQDGVVHMGLHHLFFIQRGSTRLIIDWVSGLFQAARTLNPHWLVSWSRWRSVPVPQNGWCRSCPQGACTWAAVSMVSSVLSSWREQGQESPEPGRAMPWSWSCRLLYQGVLAGSLSSLLCTLLMRETVTLKVLPKRGLPGRLSEKGHGNGLRTQSGIAWWWQLFFLFSLAFQICPGENSRIVSERKWSWNPVVKSPKSLRSASRYKGEATRWEKFQMAVINNVLTVNLLECCMG